ncbi:MAG: type II toxin-antitoxin system VapC family toxin [Dehalococcoidia bacterium]
MNRVWRFIDTSYWIALTDTGDQYHARAQSLAARIEPPFVTTDVVLLEVGNALSAMRWREIGVALLADIRASQDVEIVHLDPELFARAVELYSTRPDKEWGLIDCVSFIVMQDRGITEALAADQHFIQAGFRALLREG